MANSSIVTFMKDKVIKEMIQDADFVTAIDAPNITIRNSDKLINKYIFRFNQNIETISETDTFITVQVHIPDNSYANRGNTSIFIKPVLEIWIISHFRHMNITNIPGISDNRNDYLSKLIDEKFNGSRDFGYGELNLVSNTEGCLYDKYLYRNMKFITLDINDGQCDEER